MYHDSLVVCKCVKYLDLQPKSSHEIYFGSAPHKQSPKKAKISGNFYLSQMKMYKKRTSLHSLRTSPCFYRHEQCLLRVNNVDFALCFYLVLWIESALPLS